MKFTVTEVANRVFWKKVPGADTGGCHRCQCSFPKLLALISRVRPVHF